MSSISIEKTLEMFDERYFGVRPARSEMDALGIKRKEYCKKIEVCIRKNENEEHIKNIVNGFLKDNFYNDTSIYEINSSGYTDSTIRVIRVYGIDNVLI